MLGALFACAIATAAGLNIVTLPNVIDTDWSLAPPPLLKTLALLVFGIVLGCEVAGGPRETYGRLFRASLLFTIAFMACAAVLAYVLDSTTGLGFLVLFLALAPGGIAEVSLVALALGLDAGVCSVTKPTCEVNSVRGAVRRG